MEQARQGPHRIVILGGGFGGVYTAWRLESLWARRGAEIHITLVSRNNYFLMTPLLFEAGSGVLEPRHAVTPIRTLYDRARFVEAEVESVDLDRRAVRVATAGGEAHEIPYDHLVLALGGVTNLSLVPGSDKALTFKTLRDAIFLRNHIIELFERADVEKDPARKEQMLTIVVVGGGLVGVELVGELTPFVRNVARLYPNVPGRGMRIELIEAGPRIAPEFDEGLAAYAAETLARRGVTIRTGTKVARIETGRVDLPDGTSIPADTVVVATGVAPNPLLAALPLEKDKKGRLVTDATMRVRGREDVWALGDCAHIPDPSGNPYPPLAQHALREARRLAKNITAVLGGERPEPFVYHTKGTLAALGHFKGIGRVYKLRVRGFLAWWVWRTYYLFQMPKWSRRLRVLVDWTVALFFKNDAVQLDVTGEVAGGRRRGPHPRDEGGRGDEAAAAPHEPGRTGGEDGRGAERRKPEPAPEPAPG